MNVTEHQGWLIESRSYKSDGSRWCPRALVSVFEGGRFYMHDVLALLSVTFDTARDSDDYAVKMAKTWIEDDIRKRCPRHRLDNLKVDADEAATASTGQGRGVGMVAKVLQGFWRQDLMENRRSID